MLGMEVNDEEGVKTPAKKRTRVLTNSAAAAGLLKGAQCRGEHRHEPLLDGRARPCQRYPERFTRLICEGVKKEVDTVEWRNRMYETFDITQPSGKLMNVQEQLHAKEVPPEEDMAEGALCELRVRR